MALPALALVVFGAIFVVANPDVLGFVSERVEMVLTRVHDWLVYFSPLEVLFWLAVFWIGMGLVRPLVPGVRSSGDSPFAAVVPSDVVASEGAREVAGGDIVEGEVASSQGPMYAAYRNTLVTVIALFAVYLLFEFATLWFRDFPDGFYYSGYAHEGAAWLTLALALATVVLSLVFCGRVLDDPRLPILRRLAWVWSLENFILAMAVYNRLFVYVGFNGMTRMRIIGFFGISTVVVGFALVVWKIATDRDFLWLVRRQAWTLALAVYLFALTPVDTIVVSYNVASILAGDSQPSVQLVAHPISSEGVLRLQPLLECDDEMIREGVRAMLAEFDEEAQTLQRRRAREGWTSTQMADRVLLRRLGENRSRWDEYRDRDKRRDTIDAFHEYAYQWY